MKLDLLDINQYIEKNRLKEVTSKEIFSGSKTKTFDDQGLWSETIFGKLGSKERQTTFGYVDLNTKVFHPLVYRLIHSVSEETRNIMLEKKNYIIKNKMLKEDESGETGLTFLVNNVQKLDFEKFCKKDKSDVASFLNKNKSQIVIDKYLVIPAGIRDLNINLRNPQTMSDPINETYENLISILTFSRTAGIDEELTSQIQKVVLKLHQQITERMKGKTGFMRSSILKKSLDFSGRVVATSDPNLDLGEIGIPWHTVLNIYQPFFVYYVYNKDGDLKAEIIKYLELDENEELPLVELKKFVLLATQNLDRLPETLKNMLYHAAVEIAKDKTIIAKRDPATMRDHYYSADIKVLERGRSVVVPGLICGPLGLDFDGDTISVIPMLTQEANEESKKLNPKYNKNIWVSPISASKKHFKPNHDTIATIYSITKS